MRSSSSIGTLPIPRLLTVHQRYPKQLGFFPSSLLLSPNNIHPFRYNSTLLHPHIDLKKVRDNLIYIEQNIHNRKSPGDAKLVRTLYDEYGQLQAQVDTLRHDRNKVASSSSLTIAEKQNEGKRIKEKLHHIEARMIDIKQRLDTAALQLPCDTHPDAPIGPEANAREICTIGSLPTYSFIPKDHVVLCSWLQLADFEAGAQVAGAGFALLKNDGVLLEFALIQYALHKIIEAGFTPVLPPDLAQLSLIEACGFNPRDTSIAPTTSPHPSTTISNPSSSSSSSSAPSSTLSQVYSLKNSPLGLIGTAEIPLAGLHAGQLIDNASASLPLLYGGFSHCFRHEAGGGGTATRGLYRLHQFSKVEMFAFVAPDMDASSYLESIKESRLLRSLIHQPTLDSLRSSSSSAATLSTDTKSTDDTQKRKSSPSATVGPLSPSLGSEIMFARMVDLQIQIVTELGLHARVLDMPSEELGASAYRKVDIEAWMPGRRKIGATDNDPVGTYGEITSASNCVDYQSRRLNIRYRAGPKDNRFIHTLNGTAAAIPRLIIALLETHQQADGSVKLPECLHKYMGKSVLVPPTKRGSTKLK